MSEVRWRQMTRVEHGTCALLGNHRLETYALQGVSWYVMHPFWRGNVWATGHANSLEAAQRAAEDWVRQRTEVAPPSACPPPSVSSEQKQSSEAPSSATTGASRQSKDSGPHGGISKWPG